MYQFTCCVFVLNRWVAFENPGFSGELYILERGLYGSPEDWGGPNLKISSLQPVFQVNRTYLSTVNGWTRARL